MRPPVASPRSAQPWSALRSSAVASARTPRPVENMPTRRSRKAGRRRDGGHTFRRRVLPAKLARMNRRDFLQHSAALAALPLAGRWPHATAPRHGAPLRVDGARLNDALARFDTVGRTATGINRVAYSEGDLAGRTF